MTIKKRLRISVEDAGHAGETGLALGPGGKFDLILLDLMLPVVDGFTVCRKLREEIDTPILMVTACREEVDKIRGPEAMKDNATVAVHINRLREEIEPDPARPRYIQMIWGAGYRLRGH